MVCLTHHAHTQYALTWEIQEASIADSASSSLAVMAHRAPTSLPTACSVSVAFSAHQTAAFSKVGHQLLLGGHLARFVRKGCTACMTGSISEEEQHWVSMAGSDMTPVPPGCGDIGNTEH